jgi:hypothetical protein
MQFCLIPIFENSCWCPGLNAKDGLSITWHGSRFYKNVAAALIRRAQEALILISIGLHWPQGYAEPLIRGKGDFVDVEFYRPVPDTAVEVPDSARPQARVVLAQIDPHDLHPQ